MLSEVSMPAVCCMDKLACASPTANCALWLTQATSPALGPQVLPAALLWNSRWDRPGPECGCQPGPEASEPAASELQQAEGQSSGPAGSGGGCGKEAGLVTSDTQGPQR